MSKPTEAILLAGGHGSRLKPFTIYTSKHLLPIDTVPMIFYPLKNLELIGIKKVFMIINGHHASQWDALIESYDFGMEIVTVIQEKPLGIPAAIKCCEALIKEDNFVVALGDNLIVASNFMNCCIKQFSINNNITICGFQVAKPEAFGVASFDKCGKLIEIVEKPKNSPSNTAIVGLYKFPKSVFEEISSLKISERGELEITDLINLYIKKDCCDLIMATAATDYWIDTGTSDALMKAAIFVRTIKEESGIQLAQFSLKS